jgi:hypothetical protein
MAALPRVRFTVAAPVACFENGAPELIKASNLTYKQETHIVQKAIAVPKLLANR